MNRLPLLAPSQAKQPVSSPSALSQAWDLRSSQVNPQYSLYVPLHYERNYAYPLLIWLHGPSDDERQLRTIMRHISVRNYVGVAPRARTIIRPRAAWATRGSRTIARFTKLKIGSRSASSWRPSG